MGYSVLVPEIVEEHQGVRLVRGQIFRSTAVLHYVLAVVRIGCFWASADND